MRRTVAILILLVVVGGCAHRQNITHQRHYQEFFIGSTLSKIAYANGLQGKHIGWMIQSSREVNAMMTDRDTLVFTTGLLDLLPRDDNKFLAAIISHELSHYKLNHVHKMKKVSIATHVGIGIAVVAADLFTGFPLSGVAGDIATPAITSAYSRSQEYEADILAVEMLQNAGYKHPNQLMADTLSWLEKTVPTTNLWIWNTHPTPQDRIKNIMDN